MALSTQNLNRADESRHPRYKVAVYTDVLSMPVGHILFTDPSGLSRKGVPRYVLMFDLSPAKPFLRT